MTMIRKQVYLEPEQDREIKHEAAQRGITEAQVIRERISSPGNPTTFHRDPALRKELLEHLRYVIETSSSDGPDLVLPDREELYDDDEPVTDTTPLRYEHPRVRGGTGRP